MPDSQNDLDFGQYRIQRLLGRGGMGEVYLARDTALERDVAIKFVNAARVQDSQARARLLREAQSAARLDHPGICPVHEAGVTPDGRAYIVMPYVAGTTLSDLIAEGALPVREALSICELIAEALSAAHHLGIVHRDLKPGNVIVAPNGRPRLLDFGLAQSAIVPRAIAEAKTVTIGPDVPPSLVGTPSYMSPEQVQQRALDGRSDLFSLGAVLYECLTGVRAFDGTSPYDVMNRVMRVDPPPPSTIRKELTDRHDALCARLLAKDANDRFQSAAEVVGAIRVVLPDTGRITGTGTQPIPPPPVPGMTGRAIVGAALAIVLAAGGFGLWRAMHGTGLPPVPADADRWYRRGTEALRDGAFQSARVALQRAVELFPGHALAYARLAEADAELDDEHAAQADLLRLSSFVQDESRLPLKEQLRVHAIRAIVLRDVDEAVASYKQLVNIDPTDPGAWVDLGRAQDAAGSRDDARTAFERALEQDHDYAAAYLQLGSVESDSLRVRQALDAFGKAEALYQAASNTEGQTEVLLRRSDLLDGSNEARKARVDADRALTLAGASKNLSQQLRARLTLASITATEGRSSNAVEAATSAVTDALRAGLDLVAADGLIDLAGTFMDLERLAEADPALQRAARIADGLGARRTAARARAQLAELRRMQGDSTGAIELVDQVLPFAHDRHYRRLELTSLLIKARADNALGRIQQARDLSSNVLTLAEAIKDDARIALAASDTAAGDTQLGRYPEALGLRERAESIYRRQGDDTSLPYTLVNRAELLIRLGRQEDASRVLSEVEAGAARGLDAYRGRTPRVTFLKMLAAATSLRCGDTLQLAIGARAPEDHADSAGGVTEALEYFCAARLGRHPRDPVMSSDKNAIARAERSVWLANGALAAGDSRAAVATVSDGLSALGDLPNDDLRWTLAATGLIAARSLRERELEARMSSAYHSSIERLQKSWASDFALYVARSDLRELRTRASEH